VRKQLAEHGILATPYWRVKDLHVQVPIIPMSAIDGCGIPDLLLFLVLFGQAVLAEQLVKGDKMKCNILEVQGGTMDVLLVNGEIKQGDSVMFCGINGPIATTVRSIITAKPLQELKGQNVRFPFFWYIFGIFLVHFFLWDQWADCYHREVNY
jgi:translation initiation factor 5B